VIEEVNAMDYLKVYDLTMIMSATIIVPVVLYLVFRLKILL
jgi:hypothetical protein